MSTKKNENPFNLILEELESGKPKVKVPSNLSFGNFLRSNNKREETRIKATGTIEIFNIQGESIAKAVLRNISLGGLALETYPVLLTPHMKVIVVIEGTKAQLGAIKCTVSWVASIDHHPKFHKMIGLQFENNTSSFKTKMKLFINKLNATK